jgi:hypothetical protein
MALRALEAFVCSVLAYAAVMAWFAVPVLTVRSLAPQSSFLPWIVGGLAASLVLLLSWTLRDTVGRAFAAVTKAGGKNSRPVVGRPLPCRRVADAACMDRRLSRQSGVRWCNLHRPGAEIDRGPTRMRRRNVSLLAARIPAVPDTVAGGHSGERAAIVISNLVVFVAGPWAYCAWKRVTSNPNARMALALFVVWPGLAWQAGMPEKEQVLAALFPWIIALAVSKESARLPISIYLLCGVLLGMATLVQPALQAFPLCFSVTGSCATGVSRRPCACSA